LPSTIFSVASSHSAKVGAEIPQEPPPTCGLAIHPGSLFGEGPAGL